MDPSSYGGEAWVGSACCRTWQPLCKSAEWLPLLDWRRSDLFSNQFEEDQDLLATIPWCGIRISRSEISVPHWLLPICLSLRSVTFATFNSTRGPSTFVSVLPICGIQIPPTSMRNQIDPSVRTPSLSICGKTSKFENCLIWLDYDPKSSFTPPLHYFMIYLYIYIYLYKLKIYCDWTFIGGV